MSGFARIDERTSMMTEVRHAADLSRRDGAELGSRHGFPGATYAVWQWSALLPSVTLPRARTCPRKAAGVSPDASHK